MTPETYMRRFHGDAIPAEEFLLGESCPLTEEGLSGEGPFPREGRDGPCWEEFSDGSQPRVGDLPPECREERSCRRRREEPLPIRQGENCCDKPSLVRALKMLQDPCLSSLVDFGSFFFLTDALAVGSALTVPGDQTDNIAAPAASFRRFSPCSCDLLDVDGVAYFADPGEATVALEQVEQLSLCALKAVAFDLNDPLCPDTCEDRYFHRALWAFRRAIGEAGGTTRPQDTCGGSCDCDNCCCEGSILKELASRNLSRLATLTAGPLVLQNVTVVGALGGVLILADEDQARFYFVCAGQVEALG